MSNSLLQDVLRQGTEDQLAAKLQGLKVPDDTPPTSPRARPRSPIEYGSATSEDEDEVIQVMSIPGTPRRLFSRATSRSTSPTRSGGGAASRRLRSEPLHIASATTKALALSPSNGAKKPKSKTDPIRVMPTDLIQWTFSLLSPKDLARCSRVCLKWNKSQSLNYIWFRNLRKLEFNDTSLPTGKWTRRESKENWRKQYMKTGRELAESDITSQSRYGYATPPAMSTTGVSASGYSTPREEREARWAAEDEVGGPMAKNEAREMYKELGGRKAKSKNKVGRSEGPRDRGGWTAPDE